MLVKLLLKLTYLELRIEGRDTPLFKFQLLRKSFRFFWEACANNGSMVRVSFEFYRSTETKVDTTTILVIIS